MKTVFFLFSCLFEVLLWYIALLIGVLLFLLSIGRYNPMSELKQWKNDLIKFYDKHL